MLKCKTINPKWIIIIIMIILSMIIFNNNISRTFCEEEYQIAQCPNDLYLSSYYIKAENNENAISAVENILIENNFDINNYEIIINENIIKIIEKEKQEINEEEKAETEKQETEETITTKDNNLEIKNENVEFNDSEVTRRNIPIEIPEIIDINFNDEKINCTLSLQLYKGDKIKLLFTEIQNAIDNNYKDENVKWILKDEDGNELTGEEEIQVDILRKEGKGKIDLYVEIIKEKQEEGGTITNADIKEIKEIGICICILLTIIFLHNFTSILLGNRR